MNAKSLPSWLLVTAQRNSTKLTPPTLVIHGDKDRIVHPSGGAATARSIGGAQFHTLQGMRHQIDEVVTPYLLRVIVPHIQTAQNLCGC